MSKLKANFADKTQRRDFRTLATCHLGSGPDSAFKDLWAGAINLSVSPKTDALPFAGIIWNKATDLFSVTFPPTGDHLVHRVACHFFSSFGFKPVEDSGAFLPVSKVLEALPQLSDRDFALSPRGTDRIIEGLTHVQLATILDAVKTVNTSRAVIAEYQQEVDGLVKSAISNAFREKQPAPQPVAAPAQAAKQPAPKQRK